MLFSQRTSYKAKSSLRQLNLRAIVATSDIKRNLLACKYSSVKLSWVLLQDRSNEKNGLHLTVTILDG